LTAKEKPAINVVGDVGGKIAIIVDDMIDEVQVKRLKGPNNFS
jgi:phosphoribosylpyrophosphate synthetase